MKSKKKYFRKISEYINCCGYRFCHFTYDIEQKKNQGQLLTEKKKPDESVNTHQLSFKLVSISKPSVPGQNRRTITREY